MASLELRVNGSLVLQSPRAGGSRVVRGDVGPVTVESFTRTYDEPATLIFRVDRDVFSPAFAPDSRVELRVDGTIVFLGLSGPPQPVLSTSEQAPTQRYTAVDHSAALPPFVDRWDQTSVALKGGNLSAVLAEYLPRVSGHLRRVGIGTQFLYSGDTAAMQCYPVTVQSGTIDGGFREIAAAALGVRCFLDPNGGQPAYHFVSLFDQSQEPYDVVFEQVRVPELAIKQSVEGRCGAVRTANSEQIAQLEDQFYDELEPAWEEAQEDEWLTTLSHKATEKEVWKESPEGGAYVWQIVDDTDVADVFRRFSFADFAGQVPNDAKLAAYINVRTGEEGGDPSYTYRQVEIKEIDWDTHTLTLREPAVLDSRIYACIGNDAHAKGRAKPAKTVLAWRVLGSQFLTEDGYRIPEGGGLAGRAYQLAPITCGYERLIAVPPGVDAERYVVQAFSVLSEPVVSGRVPINGDLPNVLWKLGRRVNIKRQSGGATGMENLAAPLLGITVEFESGGRCELDFSTDRSSLLRGDVG
ncbi:MAG: hypothetical protein ABII12_03115 [Planctomycetota bacterium]